MSNKKLVNNLITFKFKCSKFIFNFINIFLFVPTKNAIKHLLTNLYLYGFCLNLIFILLSWVFDFYSFTVELFLKPFLLLLSLEFDSELFVNFVCAMFQRLCY